LARLYSLAQALGNDLGRFQAYGGRSGVSWGVVRGARVRAARCLAAPCGRLHPDAPRVAPPTTVKQHFAVIRMLGNWLVSQVLPVNPRGRGAGAEARRHEGRDAGALAGGGKEAPRVD